MAIEFDRDFVSNLTSPAKALANNEPTKPDDLEGTTTMTSNTYAAMMDALPEYPKVLHKIHHCEVEDKHQDKHQVAIYHYFDKERTEKPSVKTSAVLFLHGGGFIANSPAILRKQIEQRVDSTGVPFFAVQYRLAPEHKYPKQLEDSYAGLNWLRQNADRFNVDINRIGVYGESAGGTIAIGTSLLARDRGLDPPLAKQILIYPMLDDRKLPPRPSMEACYVWRPHDNDTAWDAVLPVQPGSDDVEFYAAPARAPTYKGLPSTYMDVGNIDLFASENSELLKRLCQDEVDVEFHMFPRVPHAFEGVSPNSMVAKYALAFRDRAIKSF